jgi:hypothetical protein
MLVDFHIKYLTRDKKPWIILGAFKISNNIDYEYRQYRWHGSKQNLIPSFVIPATKSSKI